MQECYLFLFPNLAPYTKKSCFSMYGVVKLFTLIHCIGIISMNSIPDVTSALRILGFTSMQIT